MFDTGAARTAISLGMVKLLGWENLMASTPSTSFETAAGESHYSGVIKGLVLKVHMDLAFHFTEVMVMPNNNLHLLVGADINHVFHPTMPWRGISLL